VKIKCDACGHVVRIVANTVGGMSLTFCSLCGAGVAVQSASAAPAPPAAVMAVQQLHEAAIFPYRTAAELAREDDGDSGPHLPENDYPTHIPSARYSGTAASSHVLVDQAGDPLLDEAGDLLLDEGAPASPPAADGGAISSITYVLRT
jgi:hypothetical protein